MRQRRRSKEAVLFLQEKRAVSQAPQAPPAGPPSEPAPKKKRRAFGAALLSAHRSGALTKAVDKMEVRFLAPLRHQGKYVEFLPSG